MHPAWGRDSVRLPIAPLRTLDCASKCGTRYTVRDIRCRSRSELLERFTECTMEFHLPRTSHRGASWNHRSMTNLRIRRETDGSNLGHVQMYSHLGTRVMEFRNRVYFKLKNAALPYALVHTGFLGVQTASVNVRPSIYLESGLRTACHLGQFFRF